MKMENKKLQIRNSTAEFLTFTAETGEKSIEVMYAEENVWSTQEMMAILYDTTKQNISLHLINAYEDKEIDEIWIGILSGNFIIECIKSLMGLI